METLFFMDDNRNVSIVSVIVPVYNVQSFLNECLDSIVNQTYENLEILLVDDGSTDSSGKICENYREKDGRVKVIHKANGGLSSARNAGLDLAIGDYVLFIDSDDWISHNYIQSLIDCVETNRDINIACSKIRQIKSNSMDEEIFLRTLKDGVYNKVDVVKKILLEEIGSQVVKGLYKRELWDSIRFPLNRLYEDIPTTYKVFANASKIQFISNSTYFYRYHDASISHSNKKTSYQIFLGFFERWKHSIVFYPDIADDCCSIASNYAISSLFHSYGALKYPCDRALLKKFINDNKKVFFNNKYCLKSRKFFIFIYLYFRPLFCLLSKIYYIIYK
jgi:glycosyltransferase involved in cell wall biosynthesis